MELKMTPRHIRCRENSKKYYANPEMKQKKLLDYYIKRLKLVDTDFIGCDDIPSKLKLAMEKAADIKKKNMSLL